MIHIHRNNHHKPTGTSLHITALDGIIHVNSIFTLAVFIGLSLNPNDPSNTLITNPLCSSLSTSIPESLITFHVYSFSSFLFSSLVALGLKQGFRISAHYESYRAFVGRFWVRVGMVVSGFGSVFGSGFLMMALVDVVQIKLGRLGCGQSGESFHSFAAVVPLCVLVPFGLFVYIGFVLYAFTR